MSDLIQQLLDGVNEEIIQEPRMFDEPGLPISESDVKNKIHSHRGDKPLILSKEESKVLANIINLVENDPFRRGPTFNTGDLDSLGLNIKDGNDEVSEIETGTPHQSHDSTEELPDSLISINQAVVAPNATPGHDEPIPDSILHAMDVIGGQEDQEEQVPEHMFDVENSSAVQPPPPPTSRRSASSSSQHDDAVARLVGESMTGLNTPSTGDADPGIDPQDLRETMSRLRKQTRPSNNNNLLEDIKGKGDPYHEASSKIRLL